MTAEAPVATLVCGVRRAPGEGVVMFNQSRLPKQFIVMLWAALAVGSASLIAVGQSTQPRHAPRTAPDADLDGDGIVNALDNCPIEFNPDQRDANHNSVGDVCENVRGREAGMRLDSDGDGVADLEDPCPAAATGLLSMVPGCTALALLQQPGVILGPLMSKATRLAADLRAPEMAAVRAGVEGVVGDASEAARLIRHGEVCRAGAPLADADALLAAALDEIDRQRAGALAGAGTSAVGSAAGSTASPIDGAGDVSEADMLIAWLEYWQQQVASARALNRYVAGAFAGLCAAARPGTTRGVIQSLLDAQRRIILTDGRTFGLADPMTLPSEVYEGRAVQIGGLLFDDGNGQATGIAPDGSAPFVPPALFFQCLQLRFAPVQRFPPLSSGPFVLHDPLAYRIGSVYTVEAGMAVAAASTCAPAQDSRSFPRYSLRIEISYHESATGAAITNATMAPELTASDDPVVFTSAVDPNAPATLHVTSEVRSCTQSKNFVVCGDKTPIFTTDYPLSVRSHGAMAFAVYDQTELDVNDQIPGDFRFTHVSFFTANVNVDDGTSQTFVAEGYGPFFNGIIEDQIVDSDPFAVRTTDFYPVFPAFSLGELFGETMAGMLSGVDHAAGLRWPRVRGVRNGHDFWYSATLPAIVRDVVNFCASPNAYYRLPFTIGTTVAQGQGNHPEMKPNTPGFTHSGGWAYDMLAPLDTPIHAARGGRVVKVQESLTVQCQPGGGCQPNNVFIRHQDGSIGEYVHMPQNSVLPEVGDLVQRGEQIAVVGVVGPTSGPHLHFATRTQPKPGGETFLARFEAIVSGITSLPTLTQCYEPQEGDFMLSNNKIP